MHANVVTLPRPALVACLQALYALAPSDPEARRPVLRTLLVTAHAAAGLRQPAADDTVPLALWEPQVVDIVEVLLACSLRHVETQPLGPVTYGAGDPGAR